MATLISGESGNFTAAGTWRKAATGSGAEQVADTYANILSTSYAYSPAFTLTNGEEIDGVVVRLVLFSAGSFAETLTVALSDDGGTTATYTASVSYADLSPSDTNNGAALVFVPFSSPITADGGADYKLGLKTSAGWQVSACLVGTNDWYRCFRTTADADAAPQAADNLIVIGEGVAKATTYTVTMDETASTDYGRLSIGDGGILSYGTAASTNYCLRVSGNVQVYMYGALRIGTVATPIPRTSTAVLEVDCASSGQYTIKIWGEMTAQGLSRTAGKDVTWCLLNQTVSALGTTLNVDRDTGWLSGDSVIIAQTDKNTNRNHHDVVTLSGDAGASSMTVSAVTYEHLGATPPYVAEVGLLTRNVKIRAVNPSYHTAILTYGDASVDFDWVEFSDLGYGYGQNGITLGPNAYAHALAGISYCAFRDCQDVMANSAIHYNGYKTEQVFTFNVFAPGVSACLNLDPNAGGLHTLSSNVAFGVSKICNAGNTAFAEVYYNRAAACEYLWTVQDSACTTNSPYRYNVCHDFNSNAYYTYRTATDLIRDCVFWNGLGYSNAILVRNSGTEIVLEDSVFGGTSSGAAVTPDGNARNVTAVFRRCTLGSSATQTTPSIVYITHGSTVTYVFEDCDFTDPLDPTLVIDCPSTYATPIYQCFVTFRNCTLPANVISTNLQARMARESYVVFENSGMPTHRKLTAKGWSESDTTTYHTTSPSEKLSPSTANPLPDRLQSGVRRVNVDANHSVTVSAYVYKDASYAGNEPRLILLRNVVMGIDEDTVLDTASASAETWEQLSGTTIGVDRDGVLEFVVDCDGNAGAVYVDDWVASTDAAGALQLIGDARGLSNTEDIPDFTDGNLTACFWIRLDTSVDGYRVVYGLHDDDWSGASWEINFNVGDGGRAKDTLGLYLWNGATELDAERDAPEAWQIGEWHHVAIVTSGGTTHKLYDNGVQVGADLSFAIGDMAEAIGELLGSGTSMGGLFTMAEFRLWTAALSEAEIATEMDSSTAVKTAGLYRELSLSTASGVDLSGEGHDMTVVGDLVPVGGP